MASNDDRKIEKQKTKSKIDATKSFAKKSQRVIDNKYEALSNRIIKFFRVVNSQLDFLLINSLSSKILSLFFAIALFLNVHFSSDVSVFGNSVAGWPLNDVPIVVQYDVNRYQIEDLPQSVNLSLVGSVEAIRKTRVLNKLEVIADLTTYKAGQNQIVTLSYLGVADGVDVKFNQLQYEVNIFDKKSRMYPIDYELIKKDVDNKFEYTDVVISKDKVEIKAAEHTLDKIAKVAVLVDVSKQSKPFNKISKLVVFDEDGIPIDNLTLEFNEIDVGVNVSVNGKEKNNTDKKE